MLGRTIISVIYCYLYDHSFNILTGKFRSDCVVQALINLLSDADYNVRAVAAISLARTESDAPKVINALLECLDEKDRLVRESACLALGHLKAESAVMKLERLW